MTSDRQVDIAIDKTIIMVRRSDVAEPPHPVLTGFSLSGPVPTNTLKVPHIRKDFSPISLTISRIAFRTTTTTT